MHPTCSFLQNAGVTRCSFRTLALVHSIIAWLQRFVKRINGTNRDNMSFSLVSNEILKINQIDTKLKYINLLNEPIFRNLCNTFEQSYQKSVTQVVNINSKLYYKIYINRNLLKSSFLFTLSSVYVWEIMSIKPFPIVSYYFLFELQICIIKNLFILISKM